VSVSICLLIRRCGVGGGLFFSRVRDAYFAIPLTPSLSLFPSGSLCIVSLADMMVAFIGTAAPGALTIVPFGQT